MPTNDVIYLELGTQLKRLRASAELTQSELANLMGVKNKVHIAQIETGRRRIFSDDLTIWASALGVDARKLALLTLYHYDRQAYVLLFGLSEPQI